MADGQHREIESKFEFVGELPLRGLGDVAPVAAVEPAGEQDLDAEYFDTPDLRLLDAGIALRRRTGGDAGWHLKLSRAPGDRVEVQRTLGRRRRVPTEFRDLVIVHTRGAPLIPVARVRTHRVVHQLVDAGGVAIAEVADD